MMLTRFLAACAAALAAAGCGSSDPEPPSVSPLPVACSGVTRSFADVAPLVRSCGGGEICHGAFTYDGLVNVMTSRDSCTPAVLVAPGDLSHSYLINKITGVGMCPNTERMPPGTPMALSDMQKIADWICSGASEN